MTVTAKRKRIGVIGQGIIGLSCAVRLLEAGYRVNLYSRDAFEASTSMQAGAYWWPHRVYPVRRTAQWAALSLREYRRAIAAAEPGVFRQWQRRYCYGEDEGSYALSLLDEGDVRTLEPPDSPGQSAWMVNLPVMEVPVYLPALRVTTERLGGRFFLRELAHPGELFPEMDMIINCSGLGARSLAADAGVYPIRGLVLRTSKPLHPYPSTRIVSSGSLFTLVLPRSRDCILGGSAETGNDSLLVGAEEREQLFLRCLAVEPALAGSEVLSATAALRPGRAEVRLELDLTRPGSPVIHNYGHGGAGFTLAWGCADEVVRLADNWFKRPAGLSG